MRRLAGVMGWTFFLMGSIAFLMNPLSLYAEDSSSIPPLPIVYQGLVTVDGESPTNEFVLTVRIGDWESNGVKVINGKFANLIAGPPSVAYVGNVISFHIDGLKAAETDMFELLGVPEFASVRLNFGVPKEDQVEQGESPSATSTGKADIRVTGGPSDVDESSSESVMIPETLLNGENGGDIAHHDRGDSAVSYLGWEGRKIVYTAIFGLVVALAIMGLTRIARKRVGR